MNEIEEILEELKEYRAELVHKNYPMGKINEIILKWEVKVALDKHDRRKEVGG